MSDGEKLKSDYETVELDDFEEVSDDLDVDVEFDDGSVESLMKITGESGSIDEQRASLKQLAVVEIEVEPLRESNPFLSIPTPFDLGGLPAAVAELAPPEPSQPISRPPPRSGPPPLPPGASGPSSAPPLPLSARGGETPASSPPFSFHEGHLSPLPPIASAGPISVPLPPPPGAPRSVPPPPARTPSAPPVSRRPPTKAGTNGAVGKTTLAPEAARVTSDGHTLVDLLGARSERLSESGDKVGLARVHLERAIVHETLADDAKVNASLEAALAAAPDLAPAHAMLRRRMHSSREIAAMLGHLDREIAVSSSETTGVELVVERARLLVASERFDEARAAWELVLGRSAHHSAALKGLEIDLGRRVADENASDEAWEDLANHLGRMADAYSAQRPLAAWFHVERARILEFRLGRIDEASGAYERAVRLDNGVGPVRDAFTLHCAAHHDVARLAALLADEARHEKRSARCARLELDAACLTSTLLRDDAKAIALLEKAAARAPTTPSVDRRVLDELVRLYEAGGQWHEAARSRRDRLPFFTEAPPKIYELRRLAAIEERLGNVEQAVIEVARAYELDADDATLLEDLDRLLALASGHDRRIKLWAVEAQRATDGPTRARALARAAQLAEVLGLPDEALRHLRAAWVAAPGDSEILDHLSRLLSPTPTETFDREVRALIELYSQAAQSTREAGRRIAYLEKVAVLWEEVVGDQLRAARTFEEILRVEPGRRGAVLGLERTAGRIGDDRALSRALADEATLVDEGVDSLALRVRSANVLARVDAARAAQMVQEVLAQDPQHVAGRELEARLYAEAGRWELAAESLRARIEIVVTTREKVGLWLELAQVYDVRLRDPKAAVDALREARKVDPAHPVPPEEIARVLDAAGDAKALRVAIEGLAADAITPQERARHLMRAAEIDELRSLDDAGAAELYARALAETPDDELIAERLVRVLARRVVTTTAKAGPQLFEGDAFQELTRHLAVRASIATSPEEAQATTFLLASLFAISQRDPARVRELLDTVYEADPQHVGVLRLMEAAARRGSSPQPLATALRRQSEQFTDVRARLGALWELATIEAWKLGGESVATYTRILELDPTDPSALEAAVRLAIGPARRGDQGARRAAIAALRSLCTLAHDEAARIATELRLALILELHAVDPQTERESLLATNREARDRLRQVLHLDPLSVAAATSLARVANRIGDAAAAATASISLAELSVQTKARGRYLVDAANFISGTSSDEALGAREDRNERAAQLLEKALDADPNSASAAARLAQIRREQGASERVIDVFRTALTKATSRDAIVFCGTEIARVARDILGDVGVAIDAMRAVRTAAPDHVPSLLTLSELFIAQRAWPEAVETLEDIVSRAKETTPRITALFAAASVYEKVLNEPAHAERAFRTALAIEPENPRVIRALIHRLAAKQNEPAIETEEPQTKTASKLEIASLLDRLAHVEQDPTAKCDILLELVDIRIALKDLTQAEKALVDAIATSPNHPRAFPRLARFFRNSKGTDYVSYARALAALIARGQQLGNSDARWFAALAHVEIEQLSRLRDGVAHLQRALQMEPNLHTCRYELASAHARLGEHDEATRTLLSLVSPNAKPLASISKAGAALELLERGFNAERRPDEAIVVSELRGIAGELDENRQVWLRARRLAPLDAQSAPLDRASLVSHVVPIEGRHIFLEIAHAIAGIETKVLRAELPEMGITSRDRVSKRSGHPTRALMERLAKALGITDVELVIAPMGSRTRVIAHDALWIVVPRAVTELPEPTQLASLARALARVALNVPWLEELPGPHIEALLVAAARAVKPGYGLDEVDPNSMKLVAQYEPKVHKELSRKQRQALEKLVPMMGNASAGATQRLITIDILVNALARAELRIAYLLTGDLLGAIDELRVLDLNLRQATEKPTMASAFAVLDHPFAGDVARFALTSEASALRRRVGSTWSP